MSRPDFDLTDDQLRATGSVKWTYPAPGVLPAWVAEMDVAPCPAVTAALHDAVDAGVLGYPTLDRDSALPEAVAGFLQRRFGWSIDPVSVVSCGDVMAGVIVVLQALCEPGPVVVPVPGYPPFLAAVPLTGRELVTVGFAQEKHGEDVRPVLDLDAIDAALAAGARTVLLANPHNPLGRAFTRAELEGLRDVVVRHRARVISDEIHAPLVLPGATHVPYATIEGTGGHVTTLVAASKAYNLAGLKCAQIITGSAHDLARLHALPSVANHGMSPLGAVASIAAYDDGGAWLDGLVEHLDARRAQFADLVATRLPAVGYRAPEATYLAWLDLRDHLPDDGTQDDGTQDDGTRDAQTRVLVHGRLLLSPGRDFGPGFEGFVRVNLATSQERLDRIVTALATSLAG